VEGVLGTRVVWAVTAAWRDLFQQILIKTVTFVQAPVSCLHLMANASITGVIAITLQYQRHYNRQHWSVYVTYTAWNDHVSSPVLFLDVFNMFTEFLPTVIC